MYRRSRYFLVIVNSKYALIQTYLYWFHTESFTIKNVYLLQNIDAPSDQSNNSSLTRYDQDHHRIRKRREKSTIILVSIVLIFLLCHMFRFSLKVNIIYRTRANKSRSWLVATPLTFQAKNYFSCFFYLVIWGPKTWFPTFRPLLALVRWSETRGRGAFNDFVPYARHH